jgi:hypothetical protein
MLLIQSLVQDYGITTAAGNDNIFSNTINGLISRRVLVPLSSTELQLLRVRLKMCMETPFTIYKLIISLQEVLVV